MRIAREVIGADTELFVDANGGYDRKQAIRVMAATAELDVRWFEEPVSSDDLEGLRQVRHAVTADVAAGEYGYDLTTGCPAAPAHTRCGSATPRPASSSSTSTAS